MIQIIPAILEHTSEGFEEKLKKIEGCEGLKKGGLHVDFADNQFVLNQTVGVEVLKKYPTFLSVDAHLMVKFPQAWVVPLKEAGVTRIIAHVEVGEESLKEFIDLCHSLEVKIGIAVNPNTSVGKLEPYKNLDCSFLVMCIKPGFQGEPFIKETLKKVTELKSWGHEVGVDGGINEGTIKDAINAGIDYAVIGSALVKGDIEENLEKIMQKINL